MLDGPNLSIDPGALLQQQQPFLEIDTSASGTTSSSSVPRLSTSDTENEDLEEEDETPTRPNTRSKNKMPVASSKSTSTSTTATNSKRRGGATGTAEKRRKRNLERNRAAASKCRQRKKQWQDGLEREKTELESRYKALHSESKELMVEVAQLKNFVMAHAACNEASIDNWIRKEADSFVRHMSTAYMQDAAVATTAVTGPPVTPAAGTMAQMRSPAQVNPTATPPINDALNNMFAPSGSKAPFGTAGTNIDLRPGVADNTNEDNVFNQDLLVVSSMQA